MGAFEAPNPPPTVPLDPGTQGLLNNAVTNAQNGSVQQTADSTFGNAGAMAKGLEGNPQSATNTGASTGQDPYMLNAIRSAYSAKANQGISAVKSQEGINAYMQRSQRLQQVMQSALGENQAITNQNQFLTNAYIQQETARAGMINSIFQTVDTGIGMAAGRARKSGGNVGGYNPPTSYDLGESPGIDSSGGVTSPGIY